MIGGFIASDWKIWQFYISSWLIQMHDLFRYTLPSGKMAKFSTVFGVSCFRWYFVTELGWLWHIWHFDWIITIVLFSMRYCSFISSSFLSVYSGNKVLTCSGLTCRGGEPPRVATLWLLAQLRDSDACFSLVLRSSISILECEADLKEISFLSILLSMQ